MSPLFIYLLKSTLLKISLFSSIIYFIVHLLCAWVAPWAWLSFIELDKAVVLV